MKKNNYPDTRETKIAHEQYFDFERCVGFGGIIDTYYLYLVDNQWWACRRGEGWGGSRGFYDGGEWYERIVKVRYYRGKSGTRVLGYINKRGISRKTLYLYTFVFVKDPFCAGSVLNKCFKGRRTARKAGRPPLPPGIKYRTKRYGNDLRVRAKHKGFKFEELITLPIKGKEKKVILQQPKEGKRMATPKKRKHRL
jgi:hypothetical protein